MVGNERAGANSGTGSRGTSTSTATRARSSTRTRTRTRTSQQKNGTGGAHDDLGDGVGVKQLRRVLQHHLTRRKILCGNQRPAVRLVFLRAAVTHRRVAPYPQLRRYPHARVLRLRCDPAEHDVRPRREPGLDDLLVGGGQQPALLLLVEEFEAVDLAPAPLVPACHTIIVVVRKAEPTEIGQGVGWGRCSQPQASIPLSEQSHSKSV